MYLDHAGATLYSELQMEAIFKDLTSSVFGNPRILVMVLLIMNFFVDIANLKIYLNSLFKHEFLFNLWKLALPFSPSLAFVYQRLCF